MRKSGLQLLLSSMGLDINPEELKQKYEQAKDIMPKLAEFVNKLDERLARIEETQSFLVEHIKKGQSLHVTGDESYTGRASAD